MLFYINSDSKRAENQKEQRIKKECLLIDWSTVVKRKIENDLCQFHYFWEEEDESVDSLP